MYVFVYMSITAINVMTCMTRARQADATEAACAAAAADDTPAPAPAPLFQLGPGSDCQTVITSQTSAASVFSQSLTLSIN
jgi:hypothetical protein